MAIEKMMIDANDKYVANYVVYGKAADKKLYYDAAYTEQVTQATTKRVSARCTPVRCLFPRDPFPPTTPTTRSAAGHWD